MAVQLEKTGNVGITKIRLIWVAREVVHGELSFMLVGTIQVFGHGSRT